MKKRNEFLFRAAALYRRDRLDSDPREEMEHHLTRRAAEKMAEGSAPDDARYGAQRMIGGMEQIKERCREERAGGFVWLGGDYFSGLGFIAEAGRLVSGAIDRPGAAPMAVISHELVHTRRCEEDERIC